MNKKQQTILQIGREVLENEAAAVVLVARKLDLTFIKAVELMYHSRGKILLSGVGKSGIVAKKIAATLTSTGTLSLFIHPIEAFHGDLGLVAEDDIVIAISHSGETTEILNFVRLLKSREHKVIAVTTGENSALAQLADLVLLTYVKEEACKICTTFNLAPTTSTLVTLALGDAIASALQELKGFKAEHFALFHPGGDLGHKLTKEFKENVRILV